MIGAYGEVHWVRNLRAAGQATIRLRDRDVHVTATELDPVAARTFFAVTLPGYVAHFPGIAQVILRALFRFVAPDLLTDPDKAAATRPIFLLEETVTPG